MTYKTFEQLRAEADPVAASIFADPAPTSLRPSLEGYQTPDAIKKAEELASRSVVAAAFRQDNTVGSLLSRRDLGVDNFDDGEFNPKEYLKEHPMPGYEHVIYDVLNRRRADAVREQIEMEQRDRETLAASGFMGTMAQIAAGIIDVPTLIPGTVAVRAAGGGFSVARSVIAGGLSAGAGQAVTEGLLQSTQQTRSAEESLINVGGAVVLGSLLGAGVAAALSKSDRIAMEKAIGAVSDIQAGRVPNAPVANALDGPGASVGAARVDEPDLTNIPRLRSELEVEGTAAGAVAKLTRAFNPVLRSAYRYAASARQLGNQVFESTIYRALHSAGDTTGVSAETAMRTRVTALQAEALSASESAYRAMRDAGVSMAKHQFYEEVGRAMRRGDASDNPHIAQAAAAYRKGFDTFTQDALKLGLLDPEDLNVNTAASYFSRIYNRDRLLASEPEFLEIIGRYYAERAQRSYADDAAALAEHRSRYRQRLDDLLLTGEERRARVREVTAAGGVVDQQFSHVLDIADDISEATARMRAASGEEKVRIRAEIRQLYERGGDDLKQYMKSRGELRSRRRLLTTANPDAQAAKAERLQERIMEVQEQAERSVKAYARRARNILNKIASDPVGRADELVDSTRFQIKQLQELIARSEAQVNKLSAGDVVEAAKLGELDPGADFDAAVARALAEGASPEEARRAGTRAADETTKWIKQSINATSRVQSQLQRLERLAERLGRREDMATAQREFVKTLDETADMIAREQAERSIQRGKATARLEERAAKLSPEEVAKNAEAKKAEFERILRAYEDRFDAKWGPKRAAGLEKNERYDFEAAGRDTAKDIYDKITGKVQQRDDVPSFLTAIERGPFKDRVFNVPDELLEGRGWLKDDVREVFNRHSRTVAGEIELTRRFGRGDMRDQIAAVAREYTELRGRVDAAGSVDEINAVLGHQQFGRRTDLETAKRKAQQMLSADEAGAVDDLKAGRDMLRGTYGAGENSTNFASVTRSLLHLNYLRSMGGVLLSNLSDFVRPAMVHGLGPYMTAVTQGLAQMFGGGAGAKLAMAEARKAGLMSERVLNSLMASNGDIGDPFVTKGSAIERLLQRGTSYASRWNGINLFTDWQQGIASISSQHRILEAALGNSGAGTFVHGDGTRLLRMLGVDANVQTDIARYYARHGREIDGVKVANTDEWLRAANATGDAQEIARAERAVRTYREAVNMDVNSIVSRRGLGDAPLWAQTPLGKLVTQFSGYAMGAHSRVMLRGLQENQARMVGGLVAMTAIGALTSYMTAWRGGRERFEKYVEQTSKNPAILIGEGLDRSGFFPLLFDAANRLERVSGAIGYDYRFNPVKSPIAALGVAAGAEGSPLGIASTRASDSAAAFGAIGGPTVGLVDSAIAAGRVAADLSSGKSPPKRDINQMLSAVPGQSYYGVREILQLLTKNSPYVRQ